MERLLRLRRGGAVRRFHQYPVIGDASVGAHSFNVTLILLALTEPSSNLLKAALYHDLAEYDTGDIPGNVKKEVPEVKAAIERMEERVEADLGIAVELTEEEKHWLKFSDMLEGLLFCLDQLSMGNRNVAGPFHKYLEWIMAHPIYQSNAKARDVVAQVGFKHAILWS